jgi:glycosyltransferase involved in cell wall biosynthesis
MNQIVELAQLKARQQRRLRVTMLGLRGFPDVQGGVEKHVEKLAPALAELGCDVEAIVRTGYVAKSRGGAWRGVRLARLWAPRVTGVEAFVHTFLGVLRAGVRRPDILHLHAIGPALFTPLARALGLRVVVTHHVLNYENEKWGGFARSLLRFGEWAGMAFANGRIAVSDGLAQQMSQAYRVPISAIPNGIERPWMVESTETLQAFGLEPKRYALTVARIDAQKRQLDLIAAYAALRQPSWKLALVGGADYSGSYAQAVAEAARNTPGVVMLGHQSGAALAALYSHAGAFVLPSSHEGQPIAVLEAASYGLPLILSDIPAHREIALPRARYFAVGDVAALAGHLAGAVARLVTDGPTPQERAQLMARHDWDAIAQRTLAVYFDALSNTGAGHRAGVSMPANSGELS